MATSTRKKTNQTTAVDLSSDEVYVPIPALVPRPNDPSNKKEWTYREGRAAKTDLQGRVMIIPTGETEDDFSIRQHEMLHVAFSPQLNKISQALKAVEDARIQLLAEQHGIDLADNHSVPAETAALHLLFGNVTDATLFGVASIGHDIEEEVKDLLRSLGKDEAADLIEMVRAELEKDLSFENAFRLSRVLQESDVFSEEMTVTGEDGEGEGEDGEGEGEGEGEGSGKGKGKNGEPKDGNSSGNPEDGSGNSGKSQETESGGVGAGGHSTGIVIGIPKRQENSKVKTNPLSKTPAMNNRDQVKKALEQVKSDGNIYSGLDDETRKAIESLRRKLDEPKPAWTPRPKPAPKPEKTETKTEPTPNEKGATKAGEIPKTVFEVEGKYLYPEHTKERDKGKRDEHGYVYGEWAPMTYVYPALTVKCAKKGRGPKAVDFGVVPVRLHRTMVDQKVFTESRGKRKGTILVDMSGSMSLSVSQIEELLDRAPAAVIAGYYGKSSTGSLKILAANGFRAEDVSAGGGNNLVDGPAVEWLARQKPPRIYITDEYFTMLGGVASKDSEAVKQLYRTVERYRIVIVGTPEEAIRLM